MIQSILYFTGACIFLYLGFPRKPDSGFDYDRGFADGWNAAMREQATMKPRDLL